MKTESVKIREIIAEMLNSYGSRMTIAKIVSFFKKNYKSVDLDLVKEEAKELIAEYKLVIKRGY